MCDIVSNKNNIIMNIKIKFAPYNNIVPSANRVKNLNY